MKLFRISVVAGCVLLGAGCLGQAKLSAKTKESFDTSYSEVISSLTPEKRTEFDNALRDIALIQAGLYTPLIEAKMFDNSKSNNNLGAALSSGLMSAAVTAIDTGWSQNRSKIVVENAASIVDGRTAAEIIQIAEDERTRALKAALEIYEKQLKETEKAIVDERLQVEQANKRLAEQQLILDKIVISKAKFYFSENSFRDEPTIEFNIENNSGIPIKRIFVSGRLQTPGRAVPWVDDSFNYSFAGGLENAEQHELALAPNMFGDWGQVPKDVVDGAILTLTLTEIEDASGNRVGGGTDERQESASRIKSLEEGQKKLIEKIDELKGKLGSKS